MPSEETFDQRWLVGGRWFRPHGFGGWNANGLLHSRRDSHNASEKTQCGSAQVNAILSKKLGIGKAVKFIIHLGHAASHPGAEYPAKDHPQADDGADHLPVMPPHLSISVAKRLKRRDLLALQGEQTSEGDIEKEGRQRQRWMAERCS